MQNALFYTTLHRILITTGALEMLKALFYAIFVTYLLKPCANSSMLSLLSFVYSGHTSLKFLSVDFGRCAFAQYILYVNCTH